MDRAIDAALQDTPEHRAFPVVVAEMLLDVLLDRSLSDRRLGELADSRSIGLAAGGPED